MIGLYNFFVKRGQTVSLVIGLVSTAIILFSIFGGLSSGGYDTSTDLNAVLKGGGGNGFDFLDPAIIIPEILVAICLITAVLFGIFKLITNPKSSLAMLLGIGLILAMFFVFYSMADSESTGRIGMLLEREGLSTGVSKFISGSIKTTLWLTILAFVGIVVMEIVNFFK